MEVSGRSSVGMIYSALKPCTPFVPGEWTKAVQVERAPVPA